MITSSLNKGFSLTFENGLTISVQFGVGNYCERRSLLSNPTNDLKNYDNESSNAEIAIWDNYENWFDFGNDMVKGYVCADEIADWIYKTKKAKCLEDIK